jgi:hypothetical protein
MQHSCVGLRLPSFGLPEMMICMYIHGFFKTYGCDLNWFKGRHEFNSFFLLDMKSGRTCMENASPAI